MKLVRVLARPLLSAIFFEGAVSALRKPNRAAGKASPVISTLQKAVPVLPQDEASVVRINAGVQLVAGLMLASGKLPRIAASALAVSLVPTTIAGHDFWPTDDPDAKKMQRLQFAKNLSILGGLLLAVADTGGKPSIGWRLNHLSRPNFLPDAIGRD